AGPRHGYPWRAGRGNAASLIRRLAGQWFRRSLRLRPGQKTCLIIDPFGLADIGMTEDMRSRTISSVVGRA
ncbi:MAG: hypothetical protein PHR28_07140, partial [candidate division Zixibacteria bacterium]|nr:hypothetical protein [candidate division Zixibacteria bacterium]